MRKYISIAVLGVFLFWACGSDETNNNNNNETDNNIIESDENNETSNNNEVQKPEIDADFKAFLSKFKKKNLPYSENPDGTEKFDKIPMKEQVKYLSKAEKLSESDLKDMADYTDFYYVSTPISTAKFHAIVYGRFEMGSVYYFLCTYDNDGKLISNIDFAAYELIGAGPQAGQEFNTKGELSNDMQVIVQTTEETFKYKIDEDGNINKL